MKHELWRSLLVAGALTAVPWHRAAPQEPDPRLIAHYPFRADLGDATGQNPPAHASNAPFVAGKGIYCSGRYAGRAPDPCDVRTPNLKDLDHRAFTISAQFLVPRMRFPTNSVFVLGNSWRALFYELRQDGAVRLGYNSNQFVECTVKYRIGAWHEATITFDGATARLYLDGVAGCVASGPLRTGNERAVLLTNSGNASAYYGLLRDLKVSNGVAVPARAIPVADAEDEPAPTDLAPVDAFLMKCPTRADVASVDRDLKLAFDSDPTKDEPLACTAALGSRDLSPMRKRVYNTLLLMKQLQFDRPLPWTQEPLYRWFTKAVKGLRFRADIKNSSCCGPDRMISVATANLGARYTDRWVEPALRGGLDSLLLLLAHEARHAQGLKHSCGTRDQSVDEMGSWAVQYYLARWLAEHTDQAFFTSGAIRQTERLLEESESLLKHQFCRTQPG